MKAHKYMTNFEEQLLNKNFVGNAYLNELDMASLPNLSVSEYYSRMRKVSH